MKIRLLIICGILLSNSLIAQSFQYGIAIGLGMNDLAPNNVTITNYNDAFQNLIVHRNFTANIGGAAKYKSAFLELNINLFTLDDNILNQINLKTSDNYNGSKYFILKSVSSKKEVDENKTIAYTEDYGFNSVIGLELVKFKKYSINLASGIGVQHLIERNSNAVLKEENSNTYYSANYIFKTNRLLSFSPRIEFAYHPPKYSNTISIYFYTGVHLQDSKYSTYRSLSDYTGNIISIEQMNFHKQSSTIMAGIGMRVLTPSKK